MMSSPEDVNMLANAISRQVDCLCFEAAKQRAQQFASFVMFGVRVSCVCQQWYVEIFEILCVKNWYKINHHNATRSEHAQRESLMSWERNELTKNYFGMIEIEMKCE